MLYIPLRLIAKFIIAVDRIHRRIQALDTIFILLKQGYVLPKLDQKKPRRLAPIIKRAERDLPFPQLSAVELHSPGFWEVLGSLSPLKFITDSIQHRHERKKDKDYRKAAEASRLWLEKGVFPGRSDRNGLEKLMHLLAQITLLCRESFGVGPSQPSETFYGANG